MTWDCPISPQSLCDQVNAAGKPWGLVADYDHEAERVFVCELRPQVERGAGILDCSTTHNTRRICSVSDAVPFSRVLANRIQPFEAADPAIRFRRRQEQEKQVAARVSRDHAEEFKSATRLKRRGGAMYYGGMEHTLAEYRKARAAREEYRKRRGELAKRLIDERVR